MTKLLGTFALLFFVAGSMAQSKQLSTPKSKDSTKLYTDSIRSLPPLEVKAIRVSEQAPFAKTNISKAQIA
jgi:DNA-binding transcriptional regulator YiaG